MSASDVVITHKVEITMSQEVPIDTLEEFVAAARALNAFSVKLSISAPYNDPRPGESSPGSVTLSAGRDRTRLQRDL